MNSGVNCNSGRFRGNDLADRDEGLEDAVTECRLRIGVDGGTMFCRGSIWKPQIRSSIMRSPCMNQSKLVVKLEFPTRQVELGIHCRRTLDLRNPLVFEKYEGGVVGLQ